ncbi:hypothetical protein [Mesorhizobium ventifaucium]|uniref:Uncharacterized protein n=1 Tax=Mesorhizobium ventifaucium TaxID=666020 RepID=A0ABM9DCX1_9HYPH|nr:hypothetical protein MES4922_10298 [Mesorhizobium ventifaucium]
MDGDEVLKAIDAEFGEGHDTVFVVWPVDPDQTVLGFHSDGDFGEPVFIITEFLGDECDGSHGMGFECALSGRDCGGLAPVPRQQLVEGVGGVLCNACKHIGHASYSDTADYLTGSAELLAIAAERAALDGGAA